MCERNTFRGPCGHKAVIHCCPTYNKAKQAYEWTSFAHLDKDGWEYCPSAATDRVSGNKVPCRGTDPEKDVRNDVLAACPRELAAFEIGQKPPRCPWAASNKHWICGQCQSYVSRSDYAQCQCGHWCCHEGGGTRGPCCRALEGTADVHGQKSSSSHGRGQAGESTRALPSTKITDPIKRPQDPRMDKRLDLIATGDSEHTTQTLMNICKADSRMLAVSWLSTN